MAVLDIRVPDIGDFKDVPVVELLVRVGERIAAEQGLLTVESDKATMEVPAPASGVVAEVCVGIGDKVSQGTLIVKLEATEASPLPPEPTEAAPSEVAGVRPPAPAVSSDRTALSPFRGEELVVIGGGPGGYSAAFRAADLGMRVTLIEREPVLGGVCLNAGCIPSKALLHIVEAAHEAQSLAACGVSFAAPKIDLPAMRAFKAGVIAKLTGGLSMMARARKVTVVRGEAKFKGPHALAIADADGAETEIAFQRCIIAAGSSPASLPFLPADPRIVDSTGALELPFIPRSMLIIGGGIIGLEMATVYAGLGARVDIVEIGETLLPGVDRDLTAVWRKRNEPAFGRIMTCTEVKEVVADAAGLNVKFSGQNEPRSYDLILQAAGRRPNGAALNLEAAGLAHQRGFIPVDMQMRTAVPHIFAIGDIVGNPMVAHKAVHEGHVAAEVAAGHKAAFEARTIPSVAYTNPELAWAGLTEAEAASQGIAIHVARFPWAASGRALATGADSGFTKLIFAKGGGRILGGAIAGPRAGDMIGEVALAIEMGADAVDIGRTIHPHPTFGETIGLAAEVAAGVCTDLPPVSPRP